jgi:hypothetical protein
MTLWEFVCAIDGYTEAHRSEEPPAPAMADEQLAELGIEGF